MCRLKSFLIRRNLFGNSFRIFFFTILRKRFRIIRPCSIYLYICFILLIQKGGTLHTLCRFGRNSDMLRHRIFGLLSIIGSVTFVSPICRLSACKSPACHIFYGLGSIFFFGNIYRPFSVNYFACGRNIPVFFLHIHNTVFLLRSCLCIKSDLRSPLLFKRRKGVFFSCVS